MLKFIDTWEHTRVEILLIGTTIGYIRKVPLTGYVFFASGEGALSADMLLSISNFLKIRNKT